MSKFIVTLRHAGGTIAIETWAQNVSQAVNRVLDFECAPVSAIVSIEERELT